MALQHHVRPYRNVDFPIGGEIIRLPNEIIKSYLPNLWRYQGRRAVSRGCLELEPLVRGRGTNARIALFIILRALKASQTQHGVAKELRMQLNAAGDTYALSAPNPERAMCNIFCNVARLLRPGSALGRHQEMAYAMSDWFTTLAAEYMIGPGTMFRYLQALDVIGADMTAPLHSFLRHMPVSQGKLQELASERLFRPRTLKKFTALLKDHQKKLRSRSPLDLSPEEGVVSGRDLNWKELRQQWESDPDSVMIDLRPTQYRQGHSYDSDDSYSTYSDTDYDDCLYIHRYPPLHRRPALLGPVSLGHQPWGLAQCPRAWNRQLPVAPDFRSLSSMLLEPPMHPSVRPLISRTLSFPF
ncbi:MAG: hypothetical protein L6R39_003882 [Caloplaca ligustica]|nr:MAG: hypothetical protein L6R39_003882 [Caloplaca ligustica]